MTESLDLEMLCNRCVEIAREAGRKILQIYNTDFNIEHKHDKSPLTNADMASHDTIIDALSKLTPNIPVLSEESATLPFDQRSQWTVYWLVDPLDGTREFIKRNGEFTVNIALIDHHRSVLGVIHVPVLDIDYFAYNGGGAFKSEHGDSPQTIAVKRLQTNKLTVAGSRSHGSEEMQQYMNRLTSSYDQIDMLSMGSSLKFCLVAEGKADLYPRLGLTSEWDTAAAQCIVEQAGGYVTKTDMSELQYNTKDSLLNPFFFVFGDDQQDWSGFLE
ncbi:MAG: 3'(2'),5'-bisphosphate nucleotidase CysQ [Gammaproteobacteria bacterium]|nr:3'(2'),5'-bisphosphate nucleotidase CysQ [Gammaproteobacteria bacterium]